LLEDNYDSNIGDRICANFDADLLETELKHVFEGFNSEDSEEPPSEGWGDSVLAQYEAWEGEIEASKPVSMEKMQENATESFEDVINRLATLFGAEPEEFAPAQGAMYLTNTSMLADSDSCLDLIKQQGYQMFILLRYLQDREPPCGPYDAPEQYSWSIASLQKTSYGKVFSENVCTCEITRYHWEMVPPENIAELPDPDTVYRIHFVVPYFFQQIRKREMYFKHCQERMEDITRGNPVEKGQHLLRQMRGVVHEMDHMFSLVDDPHTRPLVNYSDWIQNKPFISAAGSWLVIFIFYGTHETPYGWIPAMQYVNLLMVFVHQCFSLFWCASFYFVEVSDG